jgi:hypothetical protein
MKRPEGAALIAERIDPTRSFGQSRLSLDRRDG